MSSVVGGRCQIAAARTRGDDDGCERGRRARPPCEPSGTCLVVAADWRTASHLRMTPDVCARRASAVPLLVRRGFSRLALDACRARPTGKLRAAFLPNHRPRASGGLGGLFLRLSADGHGALHVAGPPGVGARVAALRATRPLPASPPSPPLHLVPPDAPVARGRPRRPVRRRRGEAATTPSSSSRSSQASERASCATRETTTRTTTTRMTSDDD